MTIFMLRKSKLILGGSTAAAASLAIILLFAWPGFVPMGTALADVFDTTEEYGPDTTDLEAQAEQDKENSILALAADSGQLKAEVGQGKVVNSDIVEWTGDRQVVKSISKDDHIYIDGNYRTGETMTIKGVSETTTVIENGKVISSETIQKPDIVQTFTYTPEQIAVMDAGVVGQIQTYLDSHKGDDIHIGYVPGATFGNADCPEGGCIKVSIQNFDHRADDISVLVNPETLKIVWKFD
jgi:hypothetical protein